MDLKIKKPLTDQLLWDTWMSMWHLAVLTVADELNLFQALENGPLNIKEISKKFPNHFNHGILILLRILVGLGFLRFQKQKFYLTNTAKTYLLPNSHFYWGAQLEVTNPS